MPIQFGWILEGEGGGGEMRLILSHQFFCDTRPSQDLVSSHLSPMISPFFCFCSLESCIV